ncbi:MAG: hypothetical protein HC812_04100 [Leptolyngbya sp. RL_3_1]|nr:hypothetical protein [Leptolyngbya sp. RL_3_1]
MAAAVRRDRADPHAQCQGSGTALGGGLACDNKISGHRLDLGRPAVAVDGGQIQAIAETAQMDLRARKRATLTWAALKRAVLFHHPQVQLKSPPKP